MYLADHAEAWKVSTLNRRLAVISVMHQRHGYPSPTVSPAVREVAKGIRRQTGSAQRRVAPTVIGDIRRMLAHLPDNLLATRDRALLLIGFAGALRRSELVAIDVEDITDRPEGLAATLRRSKTDQEGAGRIVAIPYGTETCPVTALRTWTEEAGITTGPVFRPIDRHENISATRLSDRAVALVLKRRAAAAGLDPAAYSGHSLRAGFATTAAAHGATERAIANQTGHRSMEVLRRYIRDGALFTDNGVIALHL